MRFAGSQLKYHSKIVPCNCVRRNSICGRERPRENSLSVFLSNKKMTHILISEQTVEICCGTSWGLLLNFTPEQINAETPACWESRANFSASFPPKAPGWSTPGRITFGDPTGLFFPWNRAPWISAQETPLKMAYKNRLQLCGVGGCGKGTLCRQESTAGSGVCGILWRWTKAPLLSLRDSMRSLGIHQKVLPWKGIFLQCHQLT